MGSQQGLINTVTQARARWMASKIYDRSSLTLDELGKIAGVGDSVKYQRRLTVETTWHSIGVLAVVKFTTVERISEVAFLRADGQQRSRWEGMHRGILRWKLSCR